MNYVKTRSSALKSLNKFGNSTIILKKYTSDTYDEETLKSVPVFEDIVGSGVKLNYTSEAIGNGDNIIKAGDVKILCIFSVAPTELTDRIVFEDITYNIIKSSNLSVDGRTDILYTLQCRKAS